MMTQQEAESLDIEFQKAFSEESVENAKAALAAWDRLWSIRIRENNFTRYFGIDSIDWQIGNWANDTVMALHNAHMYAEEIRVNRQILQIEWDDRSNLFHENAMRDIADAYADMGDVEECLRLFEKYLDEDPLWGWAWIGYYRQLHDHRPDEFLPTLESLYEKVRSGVEFRDKEDLYLELQDEFSLLGDNEKSAYFKDLREKERIKPTSWNWQQPKPIEKPKKIYPNDPCPCGSGKKYKKCCGKK